MIKCTLPHMDSDTPLRAENLRIHNKNLVLSIIYQHQAVGISQSAVVEQTGLKAPTIFRIFNELQDEQLIEAVSDSSDSTVLAKKGRRPVNFRVRRNARYSIAVDFWTAYLSIGLFNFWGERVQSTIENLTPEMTADDITRLMSVSIMTIIKSVNIPAESIMGIGVAAPGQVDLSKNLIAYYPRIKGMKEYPIVEKLSAQFHVPVILHNNCSALALGESRYGNFSARHSLFTFLLRSGVNGSFIDNDSIFVNSKHCTIEIGTVPVSEKGSLESCLRNLDNSHGTGMLFSTLDAKSVEGVEKVEQAAGYLSTAVRIISQILSPSAYLIVACSDEIAAGLAEQIKLKVSTDAFTGGTPEICHALYDPLFTQRGISDLVVSHYFF